MDIKFSKKKEELRKDPVLEFVAQGRTYVAEHGNLLMTALVVVALVYGGFQVYTRVKASSLAKARGAFGKAMILYGRDHTSEETVQALTSAAENYRSAPHSAYSAFILGHVLLDMKEYDDAVAWFELAAGSGRKAGFVRGEAREALGVCCEAKGDDDQALKYFSEVLADQEVVYRHAAIRWKMALICRRLGRNEQVVYYCKELVNDTLAGDLRRKAESLLARVGLAL